LAARTAIVLIGAARLSLLITSHRLFLTIRRIKPSRPGTT